MHACILPLGFSHLGEQTACNISHELNLYKHDILKHDACGWLMRIVHCKLCMLSLHVVKLLRLCMNLHVRDMLFLVCLHVSQIILCLQETCHPCLQRLCMA